MFVSAFPILTPWKGKTTGAAAKGCGAIFNGNIEHGSQNHGMVCKTPSESPNFVFTGKEIGDSAVELQDP